MELIWKLVLALILLLNYLGLGSDASAAERWFLNASVLDPDSKGVTLKNVLIRGNEIIQVTEAIPVKDGIAQEDLAGDLMLPGMIDMHTHAWGNGSLTYNEGFQYIGIRGTLNAMLYAGVHGALDLFGKEDQLLDYRDNQYPSMRDEAQLFAAGPCFTVTKGHCSEMGIKTRIIDSPEQVVPEVQELAAKRPNVLKVVLEQDHPRKPTVSKETLQVFLAEAKKLNIPSVVHVGSWEDVRTASELGANSITHLPFTPMPEDIPALLKANNTAIITTVGVILETQRLFKEVPKSHTDKLTRTLVNPAILEQFPVEKKSKGQVDWLKSEKWLHAKVNATDSLAKLVAQGVTIIAGSDSANLTMYQGVGLHTELFHLQQLGMSAKDILLSVTHEAYQFLGLNWGIKPGAKANFIILPIEVTEDITKTVEFKRIYLEGRIVDREKLLTYATPNWWQYGKLIMGVED
ncbi:metal-dependent hydrolase [Shewanella vesiculosa]|jgi:imidazolonepropionase-like amidohydrolase|uniref:amidohydrolase family protein n=1 Tax=Shewanella vesiculosa TaxID=518738 RepID=UPI000F4E155F|nr:amidohydrolase family protein [Shewanella vesiculosa]RPA55005.1 metal-dependent hydrolase [Shewanella vesiculosa]UJL44011.1 amidohydrolase family protein [Shewanella vesiculosa]|tara:strand:- start:660 stop:2042 length:1383 start_codon:yes stop_codon:yes gene_type:complete